MNESKTTFEELVAPVIKWMAENVHPHHVLIITDTSAELFEDEKKYTTTKYLVD